MKKLFLSIVACATMLSAMAESGTSTENMAGQGSPFKENGYSYDFSTSGSEVTIKFTLLDEYDGVVAYLWEYTNGFAESGMAYDPATKTASTTLANQKGGSTITFACKFAYAGGMSVTKQFSYTVEGEGGGEGGGGEEEKPQPTGAYCQGSDTEHSDGQPFEQGYDYLFQTIENGGSYSVEVTVTLKDNRTGVAAYMQDFTSGGLQETQIPFDIASKTTQYTFTDLADLDELNFRVKFAYAGGLSTTKAFVYTVGTDCNGQRPQKEDDEDEPTSLQSVDNNVMPNGKFFHNGHLYIIHNGKQYNAVGIEF